jgi:hypothetical protein
MYVLYVLYEYYAQRPVILLKYISNFQQNSRTLTEEIDGVTLQGGLPIDLGFGIRINPNTSKHTQQPLGSFAPLCNSIDRSNFFS